MKKLITTLFLLIFCTLFSEITQDEKIEINIKANKFIKEGNIDDAISLFEKIVEENKEDIEAKKVLAKLYKISGNLEGEKKIYIELLELGETDLRHKLAEIYYSDGEFNNALKMYEEIFKEEQAIEIMYNIGIIYENLREYEKAKEWYLKAAKKKHIESQYSLGLIYSSEGKYKEALKWYEKPAKKGHIKAQNNMGYTYYRLKNNRKAKLWLERALINAQENEEIEVIKAAQEGLDEIK